MTKKLLDKMGYNVMHDTLGDLTTGYQLERAIYFCSSLGLKYIRPALRIMDDEFANGHADTIRTTLTKMMVNAGLTPIWGPVPAGLQNHLKDSNYNTMMEKVVTIYGEIMDDFISNGISPNDFIFEGWNEADGYFAMNDGSGQTDTNVINNYLLFNKRINEECHKRNVRFMDLDSVEYPNSPNLSTVMGCYNTMMSSYSSKPDFISFHPYCERLKDDKRLPEQLLINNNFNFNNWSNLKGLPIAVSEYGYPTEDWGNPFSGNYPYQYAKDMFVRQTIILDYLNTDPIIVYSANTNHDPSEASKDDCWGTYQYHKDTSSITLSTLGRYEYYWLTSMKGYHLNGMITPTDLSSINNANINFVNFAFEYENDKEHKKLFYWNPFGNNTTSINWNNNNYKLTFNQHVQCIEN